MASDRVRKHRKHNNTFAIQLLECALVVVLFSLSYVLAGRLTYNNAFPFGWIDGFIMYAMMTAISIIVLGANKYFSFFSRPFTETAAKIISLIIMLNFIYIALLYFSRSIQLSLYYFIIADTFQLLFLLIIKRITYILKTNIFKNRIALVIGKNKEKNQLLRELSKKSLGKLAFVNFEDERLKDYVDQADNIFISGLLSKKLKDQIISYSILKDKKVFIVPETYEIAMRKAEITQLGDIPIFAISSFRLTEAQNIIKRSMDILLAGVGIILSSPIMLYAVIQIKLEDGGPILYKQIRSGLNGKEFYVIKFRSMIVDAEKHTGAVFASENDPRITKIGRLMRATRIDEIPQFFNVLSGSMSMIGPRPERPQFVEEFSRELPEYAGRLAVKPGITGLAQVMGNYTTSAENKAKFDLVYIRDYSFLLDIKILLKTVSVVFSKSQSKGFSNDQKDMFTNLPESLAIAGNNEVKISSHDHRIGKTVLAMACSLIIIFSCMFLRFSALTTTMIEASAHSVPEQYTVEPVSAVYVDSGDGIDQPSDPAITGAEDPIAPATEVLQTDETEMTNITTVSEITEEATEEQNYFAGSHEQKKIIYENHEDVVLSQEKINAAMDKMSMSEKMAIAYDLISRLNARDLMVLDKLSEGGFTAEEKAQAKEMMYQYYDDTEVGYIKKIYWEYVE